MLSISHYRKYVKNKITYILTEETSVCCPICSGKLSVHGTCRRKVIENESVQIYHLRVMKCCNCQKTHRELPSELVPYKRHSAGDIVEITSTPANICRCEIRTRLRLEVWLTWFLGYAASLCRSFSLPIPSEVSKLEQLMYYVRLTVNSANWVQHRSAVTVT